MLPPRGPVTAPGSLQMGWRMRASPEAVSEFGEPWCPSPPPGLRCREGIPRSAPSLACTGTNRSRNNFSPALARRGRVCRAQLAGAAGGRSPNARPAVRSCEPGAGPQPRPARAAGSAARAACPPARRPALPSARPTLFSLNFGAPVQGAGARRRPLRPGLGALGPTCSW